MNRFPPLTETPSLGLGLPLLLPMPTRKTGRDTPLSKKRCSEREHTGLWTLGQSGWAKLGAGAGSVPADAEEGLRKRRLALDWGKSG